MTHKFWSFSFYFLYFAALSALVPFQVLFYQKLGLNGPEIGLLTSLSPLIALVAGPFWTGLADARRAHRLVVSVTIAGAVGLALIFPAIRSFGAALAAVVLFSFFYAPIVAFADTATMTMLSETGEPQMYGRVRIGGTLGWALFAPIIGVLVQVRGINMAWWSYAAIMAIALIVAQWLHFPRSTVRVSMMGGMRTIIRSRPWVFFLALCFVVGMGFAAVNIFLPAYMIQLGGTTALMGLGLTISTVSEIPIMFYADRLLAWLGPRGLFLVSIAMTGLRLLLYALFPSPAGVLVFQVINGFTFPLLWISGVAYANANAPEGMQATAQGMFGAFVTGFGAAAGGLLAGILLEAKGGRAMYFVFSMIVLIGLVLLTALERGGVGKGERRGAG